MGLSGAERQARYRARQAAEVERLRQEAELARKRAASPKAGKVAKPPADPESEVSRLKKPF
jgi:hypothetical protein